MNLTPRQDFLKDKAKAKRHQDLVDTGEFRETCMKVLAYYALQLPSTNSPATSWNNACKLEGAKDAINLLLNFAESAEPAKNTHTPPLNPV